MPRFPVENAVNAPIQKRFMFPPLLPLHGPLRKRFSTTFAPSMGCHGANNEIMTDVADHVARSVFNKTTEDATDDTFHFNSPVEVSEESRGARNEQTVQNQC